MNPKKETESALKGAQGSRRSQVLLFGDPSGKKLVSSAWSAPNNAKQQATIPHYKQTTQNGNTESLEVCLHTAASSFEEKRAPGLK